jgi:uncharacterized protein YjiS (DUF1127 family)
MSIAHTQTLPATALLRLALAIAGAARRLHAAARKLDAWLERRRMAAAAFHDFACMADRDFQDIGIARADVHRVAWGASDRGGPNRERGCDA